MVLLRTDSWYRLIGPCYIDGMIDGQAIEAWEATAEKAEIS